MNMVNTSTTNSLYLLDKDQEIMVKSYIRGWLKAQKNYLKNEKQKNPAIKATYVSGRDRVS